MTAAAHRQQRCRQMRGWRRGRCLHRQQLHGVSTHQLGEAARRQVGMHGAGAPTLADCR